MKRQTNLYDLVERAAYRKAMPRLDLWSLVAKALVERKLPVEYPAQRMGDGSVPWPTWMIGFRAAVGRGNDPHGFGAMRYLKMFRVDSSAFDRWLKKATKAPRGPRPGASGYESVDRQAFSEIKRRIRAGKAGSPYGAALTLAREKKLAGRGTEESIARRVASRYKDHLERCG